MSFASVLTVEFEHPLLSNRKAFADSLKLKLPSKCSLTYIWGSCPLRRDNTTLTLALMTISAPVWGIHSRGGCVWKWEQLFRTRILFGRRSGGSTLNVSFVVPSLYSGVWATFVHAQPGYDLMVQCLKSPGSPARGGCLRAKAGTSHTSRLCPSPYEFLGVKPQPGEGRSLPRLRIEAGYMGLSGKDLALPSF